MAGEKVPHGLDPTQVHLGAPWRSLRVVEEVDSTNSVLAAAPTPWAVLVAERQRAGRGRLGRSWVSVPGAGLAVSAVVPAARMPLGWVPLLAGLAVVEAVRETAGVEAVLKWPNDVLLPADGERKLAGVLCTWTSAGVVVGAGINVHHTRNQLPVPRASSLALAGGEASREAVLTAYLHALARLVLAFPDDPAALRARYAGCCATLGAPVRVDQGATQRFGVARAVDDDGRLVLDTGEGDLVVAAGDVEHLRHTREDAGDR